MSNCGETSPSGNTYVDSCNEDCTVGPSIMRTPCLENEKKVNLRPLWNAILEVYKIVAKICENHGLRLYACAGTALGAVRHKGFIPWDDDFDMMMPRPDYEQFVRYAKDELPCGYVWLDRKNCKSFKYGFGKVMCSDRAMVERVSLESHLLLGHGIFVDIFPLDGCPEGWFAKKWRIVQKWLISFRSLYIDGWSSCSTARAKMAWSIGALLSPFNYKFVSQQEKIDLCETLAKKYPFGDTMQCASIGLSSYSDASQFDVKFLGSPKMVPFEDINIPVPEYVDEYLKATFGDYMKLPPIEKRVLPHSSTRIMPWRLGPIS